MIMAHGIYKMKNSMKLILSIMIAGGLFIGTMCLVSNDGQAVEESAEEVRIDMTDNYSYALPDGEWEVSHGNNYTEEELDVTFYSTDKKVVIRDQHTSVGRDIRFLPRSYFRVGEHMSNTEHILILPLLLQKTKQLILTGEK